MRIAVAGGTGFIGTALVRRLRADGHSVVRLTRRAPRAPDEINWDPSGGRLDPSDLAGIDAVVNVAGEPITATRWTAAKKRRIRDSRVDGTRLLAETLAAMEGGPQVLVVGTASGWYGDRGSEVLTEDSGMGSGFFAEVIRDWEAAALPARGAGIRVVYSRHSPVLGPGARLLSRLVPAFRLWLGGRPGVPDQWLSWVGVDDACAALARFVVDDSLEGAFNVTAPNPVTMAEFTGTLGRILHRPDWLVIPPPLVRFALGESADETLLVSQRVVPERLQKEGFEWRHTHLEPALRDFLNRPG